MIVPLAIAAIVYQDVPAEIQRVTAYRWQAGGPPAPIQIALTRNAATLSIGLPNIASAVIVLERQDGAYLIDGPIAGDRDQVERTLDRVWRRTLQGGVTGEMSLAPALEWLPAAAGAAGQQWPACWWSGTARWACMGVPLGAAGVVVAQDGHRLWSALVRSPGNGTLRESAWGRLLLVRDRGEGSPPRLKASAARPETPSRRPRSVRVETRALDDARAASVEPGAIWLAGDSSPPSAWVELRSARSGPAYLPIAEVADGSPLAPVIVLLDDTRSIDVAVESDRTSPAALALVSVFRLIDPSPPPGTRDPPPRRVFASEAIADPDGRVRIDGLGDAVYEIVAWHPGFGRGSLLLPVGVDRVTVRLRSPGIARGRVLAGGKPAAGVDVVALPDPNAFAAADDPTDLKGGDATTGPDGRFSVTLAPGGGGELRIGGGVSAVRRIPLPRVPLPIVELGDVELGSAITLSLVLDQDPGCDVRAAGPIGRTGLRIVTATRTAPGVFSITLPEEGSWEFSLLCGEEDRPLAPSVVRVSDRSSSGLTFVVR